MKGDFYFKTDHVDIQTTLLTQSDDFCTLARANYIQFLSAREQAPKGCCIKVLSSPNITLFLNLTGMVNIEQELTRLIKERERLTPMIDQYNKRIQAVGYTEKVPEDVRQTNAEKVATYEAELAATEQAILAFEAMR